MGKNINYGMEKNPRETYSVDSSGRKTVGSLQNILITTGLSASILAQGCVSYVRKELGHFHEENPVTHVEELDQERYDRHKRREKWIWGGIGAAVVGLIAYEQFYRGSKDRDDSDEKDGNPPEHGEEPPAPPPGFKFNF